MPMSEAQIRIAIKQYLRTLGIAVWDMEQNRPTRQDPGFPDLFWIWQERGWIGFWEVKRPHKTKTGFEQLTHHQEMFRAMLLTAVHTAEEKSKIAMGSRYAGFHFFVDYFIPTSVEDAKNRLVELGLLEVT